MVPPAVADASLWHEPMIAHDQPWAIHSNFMAWILLELPSFFFTMWQCIIRISDLSIFLKSFGFFSFGNRIPIASGEQSFMLMLRRLTRNCVVWRAAICTVTQVHIPRYLISWRRDYFQLRLCGSPHNQLDATSDMKEGISFPVRLPERRLRLGPGPNDLSLRNSGPPGWIRPNQKAPLHQSLGSFAWYLWGWTFQQMQSWLQSNVASTARGQRHLKSEMADHQVGQCLFDVLEAQGGVRSFSP